MFDWQSPNIILSFIFVSYCLLFFMDEETPTSLYEPVGSATKIGNFESRNNQNKLEMIMFHPVVKIQLFHVKM